MLYEVITLLAVDAYDRVGPYAPSEQGSEARVGSDQERVPGAVADLIGVALERRARGGNIGRTYSYNFV